MAGADQISPVLTGVSIGGDAASWSGAGFAVDGGAFMLGRTTVSFDRPDGGLLSLAFDRLPDGIDSLDGLPVAVQEPAEGVLQPNGVVAIDQVVIATPDFDRTAAALAAVGLGIRRERVTEAEEGGSDPVRQGFVRAGGPVIELVHTARVPEGPALGWGLGFICQTLERTVNELEGLIGPIRDAVQPGRRIATFSRDARLGLPIVLLDPEPPEHPGG